MNDCEYVDVFSDKYTKWWKRIAIITFVFKMSIALLLTFGVIIVTKGLTPYIEGEEWAEAPFTLSQINALICLFTWVYLSIKAMKVYCKW